MDPHTTFRLNLLNGKATLASHFEGEKRGSVLCYELLIVMIRKNETKHIDR